MKLKRVLQVMSAFVLVAVVGICMVACNGQSDHTPSVGDTYKYTGYEVVWDSQEAKDAFYAKAGIADDAAFKAGADEEMADLDGYIVTIKADNKLDAKVGDEVYEAAYEIKDGKMIVAVDYDGVTVNQEYKIQGNKLVMEQKIGDSYPFTIVVSYVLQ